jgi:site-specific DNA-adenine methylase
MRNGLIKENKEGTFNVKFLRHVIFSYDSSFGDFLELYHFMISVIALLE